jgi:hypothetical protein
LGCGHGGGEESGDGPQRVARDSDLGRVGVETPSASDDASIAGFGESGSGLHLAEAKRSATCGVRDFFLR